MIKKLLAGFRTTAKALFAAAAVVGVISATGCVPSPPPSPSPSQTPATSIQQPSVVNHVGTDGGFQFTVINIRTAPAIPMSAGYLTPSHGEYLIIGEQVANVSDKTGGVDWLNGNVLIDNTGRQYSADSSAAMVTSDSSTGTLQPGSWAPFREAYDVPVGTTSTAIVVHGNPFTSGVRISVEDLTPTPMPPLPTPTQ
jgi:hypothetical protein